MLQNILAIDKPEVKEISLKKDDKNLDERGKFLELLLKDIDSSLDSKDEDKLLDKLQTKLKDKEKTKDSDLDINELIKKFDTNLNHDEKFVTEVKNIMTSKFKQENILLSKADEKQFKSIDNFKDLIKFADKKGLNIKKIEFDVQKVIKDNPKIESFFNKLKGEIKTKSEDIKKFIPTQNQIKLKDKLKTKHNQKIEKKESKKIDLSTLLTKQTQSKQKEVKTNNTKHNTKNEQINLETIIKSHPKEKTTLKTQHINISNPKKEVKENVSFEKILNLGNDKKDEEIKPKVEKNHSSNIINSNTNINNEIKFKAIQAKETIKHFNNNLDEAIKNYKPPVSKVNIELNPKNLGKVEVTIIQRGNNIQVNMNTDQNNVALFQNHQAEFRQALSNIGFSNIDMSFNSNQSQERDKKQNQAKKTYKENEKIEEVGEIEIKANYRYA